jgi:hypothetical protein
MCAISFAGDSHTFTADVLYYQGQAIQHINEKLKILSYDESTIGAILLLVGIEVFPTPARVKQTLTQYNSGECVLVKLHKSTSPALGECLKFATQGA